MAIEASLHSWRVEETGQLLGNRSFCQEETIQEARHVCVCVRVCCIHTECGSEVSIYVCGVMVGRCGVEVHTGEWACGKAGKG